MKDQRKTEIKVGITALVALAAFLWILGWAKNFTFNEQHKEVSIVFNSVAGLAEGDVVTVSGVKKGFVLNIDLIDNQPVVKVRLNNNVRLNTDASFSVMMLDLMGGKKVEIHPGTSNEEMNYAVIQRGEFSGDISTAMSTLGRAEEDIIELIKDFRILAEKLNESLLSDTFTESVKTSVNNLNRLVINLSQTLQENKASISELISNANELTNGMTQFLEKNDEGISTAVSNLNVLLNNTDKLVTGINEFLNEVKSKENNAGKLLYDEELFNNIQNSLEQVKELTEILIKQLKEDGVKVDASIF